MKCVMCKGGETSPGATTITLQRESLVFVAKGVPASVCEDCGEAYVDEPTTRRVPEMAEEAVREGAEVTIRHLVPTDNRELPERRRLRAAAARG